MSAPLSPQIPMLTARPRRAFCGSNAAFIAENDRPASGRHFLPSWPGQDSRDREPLPYEREPLPYRREPGRHGGSRSRHGGSHSRKAGSRSRRGGSYSRRAESHSRHGGSHSRRAESHSRHGGSHSRPFGTLWRNLLKMNIYHAKMHHFTPEIIAPRSPQAPLLPTH